MPGRWVPSLRWIAPQALRCERPVSVRRDSELGAQPAVRLLRGNGGIIARRSLKSFPQGDIANATFTTVILLNCKCPRPRLWAESRGGIHGLFAGAAKVAGGSQMREVTEN